MNFGSTFVALETSGRLFGLDYQLLFDAAITAINVFILFLLVSVILFNPVRNMLKKRQDKITSDRETAEKNRADALAMKAEYEEKLKAANKEAELILSDARKTVLQSFYIHLKALLTGSLKLLRIQGHILTPLCPRQDV